MTVNGTPIIKYFSHLTSGVYPGGALLALSYDSVRCHVFSDDLFIKVLLWKGEDTENGVQQVVILA
jgi:hypothetical protein